MLRKRLIFVGACVVVAVLGPSVARADFIPWDALDSNSWIWSSASTPDPNLMPKMHTVNGGDFGIGFDRARGDNAARGMNSLRFSYGGVSTGHLSSTSLSGQFQVLAGGAQVLDHLLVLVAIDANSLPGDFSFTLGGRTFDPNADFGFYDAAGNDTGRPTGYYSLTNPQAEPLAYCLEKGMVTIMDLSGLSLDSTHPVTIEYAFAELPGKAVFSVYGVVAGKSYVYHTNRGLLDLNDGTSVVSTFEVVPEPCVLAVLAAGGWGLLRRRR